MRITAWFDGLTGIIGVMISESQTHQQVGGPGIISTKRQGSGFPRFPAQRSVIFSSLVYLLTNSRLLIRICAPKSERLGNRVSEYSWN